MTEVKNREISSEIIERGYSYDEYRDMIDQLLSDERLREKTTRTQCFILQK